MPKKKKRAIVRPPVKSLKRARQLTSAFHADQSGESGVSRAAYQEASQAATARHKTTSRFVFSSLTKLGRRPAAGHPRLRLLEIGAVNTQLLACPWLRTTAIDIRPAARGIEATDFFDLPLPDADDGRWEVAVCAMVLNCVPRPVDRGAMLARIRAVLQPGRGLAIIALPKRCVGGGGKGCSAHRFEAAMAAAGLGPVLDRRASPKIAFWTVGVLEGAGTPLPYSTAGGGADAATADGEFAVVVEGGVDRAG